MFEFITLLSQSFSLLFEVTDTVESVCCFPSRNLSNTDDSNSQLTPKIQNKPILKDGFCSKVHNYR